MSKEKNVDVVILGAGTAGLVALREVRKVTENFLLIQDGPYGTTCARVGCMPSKALIQIAHDYHRRHHFETQGIRGHASLHVDRAAVMQRVRELRDQFTGGMIKKTDRFGERFIKGRGRFLEPTLVEVNDLRIRTKSVIIATGSRPVIPEAWHHFGERIWTTDTFFEQRTLPDRVAVIGLGVIGLELGQAMARLGVQVTGIARSQNLGGALDPVVREAVAAAMADELTLWRGQTAELRDGTNGAIRVHTDAGESTEVDAVLLANGRQPNIDDLGLEKIGAALDEDGVPYHHPGTLQIGDLPVYIAGDVNQQYNIMHEAWDDGRVAGFNAVSASPTCFQRRAPLFITFTDPQLVRVGTDFDKLDPAGLAITELDFRDQPRAIIRHENRGVMRLYARKETGDFLGAELFAPAAEHMGHLLAWCVQQQLTVHEILRMPVYHPVLEEGLRHALEQLARQLHDEAAIPDLAFCDETPVSSLL
jgi:dihydrolipoamide dehydrogenase